MLSKVAAKLRTRMRRTNTEPGALRREQTGNSIASSALQSPSTTVLGDAEEYERVDMSIRQSTWDRAYDKLKEDDPELVCRYEETIQRLLKENDGSSSDSLEKNPNIHICDRHLLMKQGIDLGLERTQKEAKAKGRLQKVMHVTSSIRGLAYDAVKANPQAALAWTGVCLTMEILANPIVEFTAQREGIEYLMSRMEWYWKLSDALVPMMNENGPFLREEMEASIIRLLGKVLAYQMKSIQVYHQNRFLTTFGDLVKYDDWKKQLDNIKDLESQFRRDLEQYNGEAYKFYLADISDNSKGIAQELQRWRSYQDDEDCRNLINKSIPYLTKQDIESRRGGLLTECCDWFFGCTPFRNWENRPENGVLWIRAAPGKGKTMLVCAIIDWFQANRCLSYFFCKETDAKLKTQVAVLQGLIYMATKELPTLLGHVQDNRDGLKLEGDALLQSLKCTFRSILLDPLMSDAIIIVDALDECEDGGSLILDFVAEMSLLCGAKWIISSRTHMTQVRTKLKQIPGFIELNLESFALAVSNAVELFVRREVSKLWEDAEYDPAKRHEIEGDLISRADGTFLWVALACQHLSAGMEYMQSVEEVKVNIGDMPKGLDNLYEKMMKLICTLEPAERYRDVLTTVCFARRPLTLRELQCLSTSQDIRDMATERLRRVIDQCGSFLTIQGESVTFIHQSAKDYFLSTGSESRFTILPSNPQEVEQVNQDIFLRSIDSMSGILRHDIYQLVHPGKAAYEIEKPDPDPLSPIAYSCVNWIDHINKNSDNGMEAVYKNNIYNFFYHHFLHWMEALSLLREIHAGAEAMQKLKSYVVDDEDEDLRDLVYDADRFFRAFMLPAEIAPLQVYASGLVFAPSHSLMKQIHQKEAPKWVDYVSDADQDWGHSLFTLEYPHQMPKDAIFCEGGSTITSITETQVLRWDANNGTFLGIFPHDETPYSEPVLSPNGQKASWALHLTSVVQILDLVTGENTVASLGDSGLYLSHTMSYDGRYLVVATNRLLKLYDTIESDGATNEALCLGTAHLLDDFHTSMGFLGRSTLFVTITDRGGLQVWDVVNIRCLRSYDLEGQWEIKSCRDDESRFVLRCRGTIQLWHWDGDEAHHLKTREISGRWMMAVSDSGTRLAWPHEEEEEEEGEEENKCLMIIWDVDCEDEDIQLDFGPYFPETACFSADGRRLASGLFQSHDILIWDIESRSKLYTLRGHTQPISSLSFSSDNSRLVSASEDSTLRVWDTLASAQVQTIESPDGMFCSLALSNDSRWICRYGYNGKVLLWEREQDRHWTWNVAVLGEKCNVRPVFSSNSRLLAVSGNYITHVLDISGTEPRNVWELEYKVVDYFLVAFSPDSRRLVAKDDGGIKIWDLEKDKSASDSIRYPDDPTTIQLILNTKVAGSCTLAFLENGSHVVISLDHGHIGVWNFAGERLKWFRAHRQEVTCLTSTVLRGGERLISSSETHTIKIWDVDTWTCIYTLDHTGDIFQLSCHPTNSSVIYTNQGALYLDTLPLDDPAENEGCALDFYREYGFNYDGSWITKNGRLALWLPPEYRFLHKWSVVVAGRVMFVCCQSGRMLGIRFPEEDEGEW